jgi:hypothetical protein
MPLDISGSDLITHEAPFSQRVNVAYYCCPQCEVQLAAGLETSCR